MLLPSCLALWEAREHLGSVTSAGKGFLSGLSLEKRLRHVSEHYTAANAPGMPADQPWSAHETHELLLYGPDMSE